MFKLDLTKQELSEIKDKIYLTDLQERIIDYRLKEYSIVQMAMLEHCSESKISKEISKIKSKIEKILQ